MNSGSTPTPANYFDDLATPGIEELKLQLEELVLQGTISPEEARTYMQESSSMNNIKEDPNLKKQQMGALSALEELGQGGLTDMDRADINRVQTQSDTASRGKRDAIMQNAQARGMGGSGMSIMAQLQNQQDAASNQSQRDMDITALSKNRSLDALIQGGNLAGNMQNQNFNQQAQVAGANDAISRFNAQNMQNQNNLNVGNRNAAQEANLANRQSIANANVGTRNQEQQNNKGLIQQRFNNELSKRGMAQGAASEAAKIQGANSAAQANANNQNIAMGAGMASGGLGYLAAQEAAKKKRDGGY